MTKLRLLAFGFATLLPTIAFAAEPGAPASDTSTTVTPAAPPSEANIKEAIVRFNRGLQLFKENAFEGAMIEFRRAYELAPNPSVLYNIGRVCGQVKDYVCAVRSYEVYLKDATNVTPERRAEVDAELNTYRSRVGNFVVVANVEDAMVSIDDVPHGKTPVTDKLMVNSGRRTISVVKAGFIPFTRIVDLAGQDTMTINVDLLPFAGKGGEGGGSPEARHKMTTLSWVGVGSAAGLAVASGVTGVLALRASNNLTTTRYATADEAEQSSDRLAAKRLAAISDICLGASVVTLATTLVLTFVVRQKATVEPPPVAFGLGPSGASVAGRF